MNIQTTPQSQNASSKGSNSPKALQVGDSFSATILSVKNNTLTLKLLDGNEIKAQFPPSITANVGERHQFIVKDVSNHTISVEMKTNTDSKLALKQVLSALNLRPDATTQTLILNLLKRQLPISNEGVSELLKHFKKFSVQEMGLEKLLFLHETQMPIQKSSIQLLNQFIDTGLDLSSQLHTLSSLLSKLDRSLQNQIYPELQKAEAFSKIPTFIKTIVQTLFTQMPENLELSSSHLPQKVEEMSLQKISNLPPSEALAQSTENKTAVSKENIPLQADLKIPTVITTTPHTESSSKEIILPQQSYTKEVIVNKLIQSAVQLANQNTDEFLTSFSASPKTFFSWILTKTFGSNALSSDLLEFLSTDISLKGTSFKNTSSFLNENEWFQTHDLDDNQTLGMFKKLFGENHDLKSLYHNLTLKLNAIQAQLKSTNSSQQSIDLIPKIQTSIQQMENQVAFITQMNQQSPHQYLAIPIYYAGFQDMELYFMRKKDPSGNPKNAREESTLFLSLNTKKLGRFESLIHFKGKELRIQIRLSNEKMINFVKSQQSLLHELIEKTDFQLRFFDVKKSIKRITPLNADELLHENWMKSENNIDLKI